ncbi:hypothetical protein JAO76_15610 [Pontibacter sp. BT310]|uniref:DUF4905 domain-containing protein n=1 Tax=Pontibacter populi TaxID=890055 RepID=A0ABS6XEV2_9BACT|nr:MULTISPECIES: hypothetical protein [Pontibacter]MBJ6119637.1 hypothetical protein [Pontibacter sp. BT310]MBR0572064.1 hypothetical protein [Microvirga sp. STS03]MBW3366490.1 hypothetical protein [Pontibacter populi]
MKTFISDIIPKIQRYSQKLDNLTLLTNQHWVIIDDSTNSKHVYIFRTNNELLISQNGRIEKAKWEYLSQDSLLIDRKEESYLFRHGFFDENILALKVDGRPEYAFMVNESRYDGELNTADKVIDFLRNRYFLNLSQPAVHNALEAIVGGGVQTWSKHIINTFSTKDGKIEILKASSSNIEAPGNPVLLNGHTAPDGKYKLEFMFYIYVKDGVLVKSTIFG